MLFLLALALMIVGLMRPVTLVKLPDQQGTIVLALDVSGSMRATDVTPNRFEAAKQAAIAFIQERREGTQIALVAFAGSAELVQPPTTDRDKLIQALNRLTLARGTAIGDGIVTGLNSIDENLNGPADAPAALTPAPVVRLTPVPKGQYAPAIVVVLTDGQSNRGMLPVDAAKLAAERGVRVYTVGMGTKAGGVVGSPFGGFRSDLDEATLRQVADLTEGEYFYAATQHDLTAVYDRLSKQLVLRVERIEVTAIVTAVAAGLFLLAGILSMLWFDALP